MNVTTISTGTNTPTTTITKTYKIEIDDGHMSLQSDDDDDDLLSSEGSIYGEAELAQLTANDEVANQLAAAGPVGVAAAAAIASSKKRKKPHSFETNPSVRKRQQNRLLRKLRGIIYEFTGRVGKQAVVLVATPGKPNTSYKVFGAKPLEDVVRNLKNIVMDELENALAQQAPPPPQEDPSLFELPPLIIDGIPTPVEKMTQAQLRAFIPLMLKYSTGRGKPGWGRESTRPPWWPKELPWANVRMDARSEDDKQKISWTHALRKIVINCYKYHGREDLLPTFADDDDKVNALISQSDDEEEEEEMKLSTQAQVQSVQHISTPLTHTSYTTGTVLSTIQNADGTVSLIQVDPNNPIITLPDGTTAQVQGVATLHQGENGTTIQTVQSLADCGGHENMTVDLTEATVAQDGQIYITGEDGQGYPVSVSNMITVPVSASMYQSMMANIQQINSDGTVCITPMQVDSNSSNNSNCNTSSSNNNQNNNNNNNANQYQCYSIMTTTGARLLNTNNLSPNSSVNFQQNTTNANNNNNDSKCQIYAATLSNSNSSQNNSTQQHNSNSIQQQQQQQAKFLIASNFNVNQQQIQQLTNNNNVLQLSTLTNSNGKGSPQIIPLSTATIVPLPIVVANALNNANLSSANSSSSNVLNTVNDLASLSVAVNQKSSRRNKRRKQSFNKVLPIKLEENLSSPSQISGRNNNNPSMRNHNTNNNNDGDGNIAIDSATNNNNGSLNVNANQDNMEDTLPSKAIKLEDLEN